MHIRRGSGIVFGLLALLILAVPVLAQEGEPTCEDEAGGKPAVQVSQEGRSDFVVTGCNFESGESITVSARLKQGDGDWMWLESAQARADSEGAFEARIGGPTGGLDFANGYQIEVTAEGANGSSAESGMAAIAGGGMPPQNLPETGGGGMRDSEPGVHLLVGIAALGLSLVVLALRRLRAHLQ